MASLPIWCGSSFYLDSLHGFFRRRTRKNFDLLKVEQHTPTFSDLFAIFTRISTFFTIFILFSEVFFSYLYIPLMPSKKQEVEVSEAVEIADQEMVDTEALEEEIPVIDSNKIQIVLLILLCF